MDVYNFDFYEVNSAIMKNAQIYFYKKRHPRERVGVIVPYYFASLFNAADEIINIDREICIKHGINEYRKIIDVYNDEVRLEKKLIDYIDVCCERKDVSLKEKI